MLPQLSMGGDSNISSPWKPTQAFFKAGFFLSPWWDLVTCFRFLSFPMSICGTCWPWMTLLCSSLQVWLGTSDDWIGTSDRPTKEQGLFRGWTYGFLHRLCVFNTLALAMKRQCKWGAHAISRAQVRGIFFACSNTSGYRCTGTVYTLTYLHIFTWLHPTHAFTRTLNVPLCEWMHRDTRTCIIV